MTDTTLLSALFKPQTAAPREAGKRQAAQAGEPFSSAFNTAYSDKHQRPGPESVRREPPRESSPPAPSPAKEPVGRPDTRGKSSAPEPAAAPMRGRPSTTDSAANEGTVAHDKDAKIEGGTDKSADAELTDEQRDALEALPAEQKAALQAMEPERRSELLALMLEQSADLEGLTPEIAAKLADLSDVEREKLQGLLNQLAVLFSAEQNVNETLAQAERLINDQVADTDLAHWLKTQLNSVVEQVNAQPDSDAKLALAQWLAGVQMGVVRSARQNVVAGSAKLDGIATAAGEAAATKPLSPTEADKFALKGADDKAPAGELAVKEGDRLLGKHSIIRLRDEGGQANTLDKQLDAGKLVDVAKLHNLFSSRGEATDRVSQASISALSDLTGQRSPAAIEVKAPTLQSQLGARFASPGWGDAVGQKVLWMASQKISSAELRMDPPDLGPLQVRVSVQNDQAHITFTSQQAVVREALDQNAFRLREMLAEQGMQQVNVDVSDRQADHSGEEQEPGEGRRGFGTRGGEADDDTQASTAAAASAVVRLIDQYA